MIRVSIIGTAGRGPEVLNRVDYTSMYESAKFHIDTLKHKHKDLPIHVISGGAAISDHLAISLFMKDQVEHLILHLPAEYKNGRFVETNSKYDTGKTANYYHDKFSKWMKANTLSAIQMAKDKGANIITHKGFKQRNMYVGATNVLIAYTFGTKSSICIREKNQPEYSNSKLAGLKDGGTAHTWDNSIANVKIHVNLFDLLGYRND